MDNPQHYQPLSYALHPPPTTIQPQSTYTPSTMYQHKAPAADTNDQREEEEEEEEEEDDDDEGFVEEQLNRNEPDNQGSNPASPPSKQPGGSDSRTEQSTQEQNSAQEPERKRRPGRPRGSKNRKPRAGTSKQEGAFHYQGQAAATTSAPPQHPEVNAQNQQYYEFQWRVLNLCAEFYTAAEELVKGTPPLVVAQCYHMGPGAKVDPLIMLSDAKRICDTLLANPSQLVSSPPPPIYPVIPSLYQPPVPPQAVPAASTAAPAPSSTSKPTSTPNMISNPQSFVVSLGAQSPYAQYPVYAAPSGQYSTTAPYYHQYPGYPATTYYPQSQPLPTAQASTSGTTPSASVTQVSSSATTAGAGVTGNQGAWSDEETEQLKKLAEDSKSVGTSGEIDWDWVIRNWGAGRTRHQILIKATSLGLKESSSRGVKRRRETETTGEAPSPSVPPTPTPTAPSNPQPTISAPTSASPSHSQATSTPAASPALQHQQRPTSSKGPSSSVSASSTAFPYPMPTVARDVPSPIIATSSIGQDQQRTSYYRPRPNQSESSSKPVSGTSHPTTHHYMYQPNGTTGSGSRTGRENGK